MAMTHRKKYPVRTLTEQERQRLEQVGRSTSMYDSRTSRFMVNLCENGAMVEHTETQ